MIDHFGITVSDIAVSRNFYANTLSTLGYIQHKNDPNSASFGVPKGHGKSADPAGDFWISIGSPMQPRVHFAFSAATRADVEAFHRAAVLAGGTSNGLPGLRPDYHPHRAIY